MASTSLHELKTFDGASVQGVLHSVPGATTVVTIAHPREQLAHNPMVGSLLQRGAAVRTQDTRVLYEDEKFGHGLTRVISS